MLAINPGAKLVLVEEVMLQAIPELDHYYAFNTASGDQYQLNHTAHWILEAIGHCNDFQTVAGEFAQAFDIELERAKEDLAEVIQSALENSIIREVKP